MKGKIKNRRCSVRKWKRLLSMMLSMIVAVTLAFNVMPPMEVKAASLIGICDYCGHSGNEHNMIMITAYCTTCRKNCSTNGWKYHTTHYGGSATCTAKAVCERCNQPYGELAAHTKGTHHDANAATCIATGNVEYWECSTSGCEAKLDASAQVIADVTIPSTNHILSYSSSGASITATCSRSSDHTYTLTLEASDATYSGSNVTASYGSGQAESWKTATGEDAPAITYEYKATSNGTYAPTSETKNVGYYKASASAHDQTASVEFQISKADPSATAPSANSLTYTGSEQTLVSAGSTGDGTLKYALASDGTYNTDIPTATDAGTYYVYYQVIGDAQHNDKTFESPVSVTINKADYDGSKSASQFIVKGKAITNKKLVLPSIPDGMEYGTPTGFTTPITEASVADGKLVYSLDNSSESSSSYTITVPVAEKSGEHSNYNNYDITVSLTTCSHDSEHQTSIAEIPATCLKDGKKAHNKCNDCGSNLISNEIVSDADLAINKLGHNWVDGKCSRCGTLCDHNEVTTISTDTEKKPVIKETITCDVIGQSTLKVTADISDGTAIVADILPENIEELVKGDKPITTLIIDVSTASQAVNTVEVSTNTMMELAKALEDKTNSLETLTIETSYSKVEIDLTALKAVISQAGGNKIRLVVVKTQQTQNLNEVQQAALSDKKVEQTFEAYFESDGKRIGDFMGGKATVEINFIVPEGKDKQFYHVFYLDKNGSMTRYATRFTATGLEFTTTHFSDYCIVYDETLKNDTKLDTTGMYVIQKGDSFWTIAKKYKMNVMELILLNKELAKQKYISPGQTMKVSFPF